LRGVICEAEKEAGKEDVSLSTSHTHGLIPYSEAFLQSIIFLSLDQAGVALSHVHFDGINGLLQVTAQVYAWNILCFLGPQNPLNPY